MSARSYVVRFLVHTGMVVGAIFAVTILLAAMPGHHAPSVEAISGPQQQAPKSRFSGNARHGSLTAQMSSNAPDGHGWRRTGNEQAAVNDMAHMHGGRTHAHDGDAHAISRGYTARQRNCDATSRRN